MGEALGALQFVQDWISVARPHLKTRKLPMSPKYVQAALKTAIVMAGFGIAYAGAR